MIILRKEKYSHADLCFFASRWLRNYARCSVVATELATMSAEIPDAIGWRSNISVLVECKTSRADFMQDAKKPFRIDPAKGVGNWRFYLTPKGLISVDELPDNWGLLELNMGRVRRVHGGPKGNYWFKAPFASRKDSEVVMLVSAARRISGEWGEKQKRRIYVEAATDMVAGV